MLWTLQSYIFRELGKTFVLTAIGLVAVIGLGGGVMNMIELEGVTALQVLKIMGLILPVAATLTLPVSALYSATVTYGRLSADNELTACRSGGINIHLLFLPTMVISLLSALCSFMFINFMIPNMIRNLDRFVGDDIPRIIQQRLSTAERFSLRDKFVIYADTTELQKTDDGKPLLRLSGVAFTETEDDAWVRFGTARSVLIAFGERDGRPTLAADMSGIAVYDAERGGFAEVANQPLAEAVIPRGLPVKVKWLTLGGLLQYGRHPASFPSVEAEVERLRGAIARGLLFAYARKSFEQSGEVRLGDNRVTLSIISNRCSVDEERRPRYYDNLVITEKWADGLTRVVRADGATLDVNRSGTLDELTVELAAIGNVAIQDPRNGDTVIHRDREKFERVTLPADVVAGARSYTTDGLLDPRGKPLNLGKWIDERREKVIRGVAEIDREITGEFHARLAFSVSVFVLVILGAALGIVFRGAQVLVAFGISFVPSIFVISAIIMGKQLIDKPGMALAGIAVIWCGILLVALGDIFVMTKVVRR